ncbi:MAG: tRNA dihydrouridine synthase DusB [Magnetococcales bacterium]|nr:tRNA dihydrouridine synthase DusB [Magnetococcales bacterium]
MQTPDAIDRLFAVRGGERSRPPLILAPMAGVTDLPFRSLARRFGADWTVSEMISSQAMIRHVPKCAKLALAGEEEAPLTVQIAGADPVAMAEAARMQADLGARVIDINMGCPVKKIVSTGAGAALLKDETLAARVMESVARAVSIPVTVKIRLGWDAATRNGVAIARLAEASGMCCITVHGRTRAQMYEGRADWEAVGEIKSRVRIPVIGNGDVCSPEQALELWQRFGVDGIMIGRAALGRPWIFREIACFLATGRHLPPPTLEERAALIEEHYHAMLEHHGLRTGHLLGRKHVSWFTRGLPGGAALRESLNRTPSPEAVIPLLRAFLEPLLQARAA